MTRNQKIGITIGFIAVAILAYYAGKTGFWGMTKPKLTSTTATNGPAVNTGTPVAM